MKLFFYVYVTSASEIFSRAPGARVQFRKNSRRWIVFPHLDATFSDFGLVLCIVLRTSEPSNRPSDGSYLISAANDRESFTVKMRSEPSHAPTDGSEARSTALRAPLHSTIRTFSLYCCEDSGLWKQDLACFQSLSFDLIRYIMIWSFLRDSSSLRFPCFILGSDFATSFFYNVTFYKCIFWCKNIFVGCDIIKK